MGDDAADENKAEHLRGYARHLNSRYWFLALVIGILALNVFMRVPMLRFQGLFEPDGFFYYSVIRQAVMNNFTVSGQLDISGFPWHNSIGEAPGLIYMTVVPYFLLRFTGISYYTVMRLLPVLFGLLYAILAYCLAKSLANSRALGLLAMFFVSVSSGNIARTAALVYRGDTFVSLFLMVSLLFMLRAYKSSGRRELLANAAASAFVLSLGIVVWNGAPFIVVIYMTALLLMLAFGFLKADEGALRVNATLAAGLLLTFGLEQVWEFAGLGRPGLVLNGTAFFLFWAPVMAGSLAAVYLVRNRHRIGFIGTAKRRAFAMVAAAIALALVLILGFGAEISKVAAVAGLSSRGTPIGQTTQELQSPYYGFLFASFSFQLWLAPLAIALFVLFAHKMHNKEHFRIKGVTLNASPGFVAVFSYFMVTIALQSAMIRWNALLSIPMAILAAYGAYALGKLLRDVVIVHRMAVASVAVALDAVIGYVLYFDIVPKLAGSNFVMAITAALIAAALAAAFAYNIYATAKARIRLGHVYAMLIAAMLLFNIYTTYIASYTTTQLDGINPQFLDAMAWMRNNTPANATVWAIWPDGSVVEGWANRTSYMDSVGGENYTRIYRAPEFLFNSSYDTQYLYSVGKPEYIVSRSFWYQEIGGLAVEGSITNASRFGYIILDSLNITSNETTKFYTFSSHSPPYYKALMMLQPQKNGTNKFVAFLGAGSSNQYLPMKHVMFFNTSNNAYNVVDSESNAINYTLLVSYSGSKISGGVVLGPDLFNSNFFRLTFLCNYYACPYDNDNVTLTPVFINGDTRIFKVNYK